MYTLSTSLLTEDGSKKQPKHAGVFSCVCVCAWCARARVCVDK